MKTTQYLLAGFIAVFLVAALDAQNLENKSESLDSSGVLLYEQDFSELDEGTLSGQDGWVSKKDKRDVYVQKSTQLWKGKPLGLAAMLGKNLKDKTEAIAIRKLDKRYESGKIVLVFDAKEVRYGGVALGDDSLDSWVNVEQGALKPTSVMLQVPDSFDRADTGLSSARFRITICLDSKTATGQYEGNPKKFLDGTFTNSFKEQKLPDNFAVTHIRIKMAHREGYDQGVVDNMSIYYVSGDTEKRDGKDGT